MPFIYAITASRSLRRSSQAMVVISVAERRRSPGCGRWKIEKQKTRRPQLRCNALLCFYLFTNDCISANDRFVVASEQSMLLMTLICRTSFNSLLEHNRQYCKPQSVKSCPRFQDGRLIVIVASDHFANVLLILPSDRRAMEWTHHKLEHDDLFCCQC